MKSVNHRFLEMSIRLPKQMTVFEDKIRKIIAQQVRRGRIEVSISIAGEGLVERKLSGIGRFLSSTNRLWKI